jgi:hypothetical protein
VAKVAARVRPKKMAKVLAISRCTAHAIKLGKLAGIGGSIVLCFKVKNSRTKAKSEGLAKLILSNRTLPTFYNYNFSKIIIRTQDCST